MLISFKTYCSPTLLESSNIVQFYHGGSKWLEKPSIMPTKNNRYEYGPGIYLTTSYNRAKSYAKGSNIVQIISVDFPKIVLPKSVKLDISEVLKLLSSIRVKNRKRLTDDLKMSFDRGDTTADILINLLVNNEALGGDSGPIVAAWLADHGVTADINRMHSEEWLVVFDPSIILKATKVDPKKVTSDFVFDLPLIYNKL